MSKKPDPEFGPVPDEMRADPPEKIYLQVDASEVCWCAERVFDSDVMYIRADKTLQDIYLSQGYDL